MEFLCIINAPTIAKVPKRVLEGDSDSDTEYDGPTGDSTHSGTGGAHPQPGCLPRLCAKSPPPATEVPTHAPAPAPVPAPPPVDNTPSSRIGGRQQSKLVALFSHKNVLVTGEAKSEEDAGVHASESPSAAAVGLSGVDPPEPPPPIAVPIHPVPPAETPPSDVVVAEELVGVGVGAGEAKPGADEDDDDDDDDEHMEFPIYEHLKEVEKSYLRFAGPWEWTSNTEGRHTIMFRIYARNHIPRVLEILASFTGIGGHDPPLPQCGSVVVIPLEAGRPEYQPPKAEENSGPDLYTADELGTKLFVDPIVKAVKAGAEVALVIIASVVAGAGLATNNAVVIVASMLISPLMGPVLAMTFGAFIFDWELVKTGVVSECLGLFLCVLVGAVMGLTMGSWAEEEQFQWPNPEMESRGEVTALYLGLVIAFPSGCGVALSVLGNNTASLVGVAISASLLPPLVNAGMMWVHGIVNDHLYDFDEVVDKDRFVTLAGNSFALTALNIGTIFVAALFMFYIKEAAPIPGKSFLFSRTKFMRAHTIKTRRLGHHTHADESVSLSQLREARRLFEEQAMKIGHYPDLSTALATVHHDQATVHRPNAFALFQSRVPIPEMPKRRGILRRNSKSPKKRSPKPQ